MCGRISLGPAPIVCGIRYASAATNRISAAMANRLLQTNIGNTSISPAYSGSTPMVEYHRPFVSAIIEKDLHAAVGQLQGPGGSGSRTVDAAGGRIRGLSPSTFRM